MKINPYIVQSLIRLLKIFNKWKSIKTLFRKDTLKKEEMSCQTSITTFKVAREPLLVHKIPSLP